MTVAAPSDSHASLCEVVGEDHVLTKPDRVKPYCVDERNLFTGTPLAVIRPEHTRDVERIVQWCVTHNVPLVPQGGNTGYCGGATPAAGKRELVISLERMNQIAHTKSSDNE